MKALPHEAIKIKYEQLSPHLSEKSLRLWAGSEAAQLGYGGIQAVSRATGLTPKTVSRGISELSTTPESLIENQSGIRKEGGGRKKLTETNPQLVLTLEKLIGPHTLGDPMKPLRWTSKSLRKLTLELNQQGHRIGKSTVNKILKELDYSLQTNRKRFEGKQHPDRDAQFEYINRVGTGF